MSYGANILKEEAAYYTLNNATITDGVLHIGAGGSATQVLQTSDLASITEWLQFTCISDSYSERYVPDIQVLIYAKMSEGDTPHTNALLFPVQINPNKYSCEFQLIPGEYTEMYVTLASKKGINLTLWELCPEVSDDDITVIIEGVQQSLPRLLFDYNTYPLAVEQAETAVAFITCRLLQNTDLQGHFLMTFTASENATVTLRFYDNEAEELFAPLYYDIRAGYNTLSVPHAYLDRLAGIHSYMVTAQTTVGSLYVDTRKILFTIDGGYLAEREIDVAMDITDIAIRQLASDNGPDEIWIVGLDAGEALVRKRRYNESNASVAFEPVGSLGKATAAAIEFNGAWVLRFGADQFTIETEENPWYFWVTDDGVLHGCHGLPTEANPAIDLATNVVGDIKAVRGYSSIDYIEQDQGLIVAYIKDDGLPYYRTYSYNTAAQEVIWEREIALGVPANVYNFVNVHRLNDYRIGFELSGDTSNLWIITDRTYVGQSAFPENFNVSPYFMDDDWKPTLFGYYDVDELDPPVEITSIEYEVTKELNEETEKEETVYQLTVILNRNIFGPEEYYPMLSRFTVTGVNVIKVKSWENTEEQTKIVLHLNKGLGILYTFTLKGSNYLRYKVGDQTFVLSWNTSIEIDNTNYISIEGSKAEDNLVVINPTLNPVIAIQGMDYITIKPQENIELNTADISIDIYNTTQQTLLPAESIQLMNTIIQINYYDASEAPI